ncbi:potassium channel family protein [Cerasicoccus frondis]|uniref:potassium channel family protein n=1 Tax=Cerasicoccus frondis TaxID=490090 RepID=UPI002852A628|nr:ion channel [Cerasicoccus frondis]
MPESSLLHQLELRKYFWLLVALITLIILAPIFDDDTWGAPVLGVITMITLALALSSIANEKAVLWIGILLGVVAYAISTYAFALGKPPLVALPFQLAFYGFINLSILRDVLVARRINADSICGGICVYLLLGINWALIFALLEFMHPGSLVANLPSGQESVSTPMDFVYFSFVTLTTLGYGDIVPVSNGTRSAAIGASVSGVLFIAVFIGRLVGLTTAQVNADQDTAS